MSVSLSAIETGALARSVPGDRFQSVSFGRGTHDGESKFGKQAESMDPSKLTIARDRAEIREIGRS